MTRILGIDPGSLITGYGIIDVDGPRNHYVTSGCLRLPGESLPSRLRVIFVELGELMDIHKPDQMAIEAVFMHRNADSALKLGQARGAAICAGVIRDLPVAEYSPRQVKQAVVGKGGATKFQIQHMVKVLLKLAGAPQADAADALAIALCHGHTNQTLMQVPTARRARAGRVR
ncbi:MAG: crossover junction endodeoxyribonuclease RuvC [Gammaproteobacteria bacterium]